MSSDTTPSCSQAQPRKPDTKTLWCAYAIAPVVAPLLFAIAFFVIGIIALRLNPDFTGTPAGLILVPFLSMTVGVAASYFIAGVIGMPIAFYLRNREILNGYTIHSAAVLWALLVVGGLSLATYLSRSAPRPSLAEFVWATLIFFVTITPCITLSATTFWWIVRHDIRRLSLRTLFMLITIVAVLSGIVVAIAR